MVHISSLFFALCLAPAAAFGLPTPTNTDAVILNARQPNTPVRRQEAAPSMARRGLTKRKQADSSYIPGDKKDYSAFLCPLTVQSTKVLSVPNNPSHVTSSERPLKACPAPGTGAAGNLVDGLTPQQLANQITTLADWFRVGFQCVDFETDVTDCGGCSGFATGENCSLIPLSVRTACVQSSCQVLSCDPGYMVSPDKTSCVQDPSSVHSEAHEEWEAEEERLLEESDNQVVIRRR